MGFVRAKLPLCLLLLSVLVSSALGQWDPQHGGKGEEFRQCMEKCYGAGLYEFECASLCGQQQGYGRRGVQSQGEDNQQSGSRGDQEEFGECMAMCTMQKMYMSECIRRCAKEQGQRIIEQDNNQYSGIITGGENDYNECVRKCLISWPTLQPLCISRCAKEQSRQQGNQQWDPEQGGKSQEFSKCMERCTPQQGVYQCMRKCYEHQYSDLNQEGYSWQCMERCEKQGQEPWQCKRECSSPGQGQCRYPPFCVGLK